MTPKDIIDQTNAYRTSVGLKPLKSNDALTKAAQAAANDMSKSGYFAHTAPNGGKSFTDWPKDNGYNYQYVGQNLANGFNTATDTLKAWKASPAHNANLTSKNYSDIGIGFATGTYQGKPSTYVIQYFGTPENPTVNATPVTKPLQTPPTKSVPTNSPPIYTSPQPKPASTVSHTTPMVQSK